LSAAVRREGRLINMGFETKNAPKCEWCKAKSNCFYGLLDKKSKKEWTDIRVANRFKGDDILFFDGEKPTGMYILCSGKAKLYKSTRTGQQLITRVHNPGDLIGYRAVLAEENYAGTAMAMEDSTVSLIPSDTFDRFLQSDPKAMMAFLKKMAKELGASEAKSRDIAYKPAKGRLGDVLLKLMRKNGRPEPVVAGVKRKEIAEMAGLTIETTVRLLNDFEKQGLIRREVKDIAILKPERLQTLATSLN
jgi:CRP/FNR family transcriptional regulator, polysaccharide utilization system transcription regulator